MHIPVLFQEINCLLKTLKEIPSFPVVVDGTFGRGGHTNLLLKHFPESKIFAFDQDPEAINWGKSQNFYKNILWVQDCFSNFVHHIHEPISGMILDLGVSSPQLDQPERGFSFRSCGPLDMRMSKSGITAKDILKNASEKELSNIFWTYGQERRARYFAKIIKNHKGPLETTTDLAQCICNALGIRKKTFDLHPATRVFQALRIVVNRELEVLFQTLPKAISSLAPFGILIVISFHSLEDGIVKRAIQACSKDQYRFSKKPIIPTDLEIKENPRSRSAKLRWVQRCEALL
ncbi:MULTISPECIES: 16S rRNA (cytosine(1402)-N(4))-methyltransferase RsmH [Holospora]|uniref:Ribosomal RNA small subunit methyltransferase H n=2 Tax=Holospora TaxID=44747 RepID=A0A061JIL4_9PROT|nr:MULTISPECIES: 16S rRNA (cytosine(1402)-N(4))-methyltransferase RsmH [Holospora]ETZ04924.1 ribosomal RNA small subunit methyltransferase H [Holospora undulata HU1]GAJ46317.1 ribosomal RNA small subunit methyltransferase H [Holospora elegans E1]